MGYSRVKLSKPDQLLHLCYSETCTEIPLNSWGEEGHLLQGDQVYKTIRFRGLEPIIMASEIFGQARNICVVFKTSLVAWQNT